jgi:hypothetical protein
MATEPAIEALSDDALLTRVDVTYVGSNAAMAHWLALVAEVDRRRLWADDGHQGLAAWLRWKYRLCRQTSKEKARVARGARIWAAATAAFAAGDIPYSSLRQIIRLPAYDAETEARMIDVAIHGTTDDVARLVNRAIDIHTQNKNQYKRDKPNDDGGDTANGNDTRGNDTRGNDTRGNDTRGNDTRGNDTRGNDTREDDDADAFDRRRFWAARTIGGVVTGGFTFGPAEGALLLAALDTYLDGRHPGAPRPEGVAAATPQPTGSNDDRTIDQRRADAVIEMVCAYLAGGAPDLSGADRHTVNVVCDLETLLSGELGDDACCETLDGTQLPASLLRRLRCDAAMVRVLTNQGRIIDIGTRDRNIPPAQRKKLLLRDRGCVYPGCPHSRWVDAHHITWVEDGGPTDSSNLVLLCGYHHDLIHRKGWTIAGHPDLGPVTFHRPDGTAIPQVPPRRAA